MRKNLGVFVSLALCSFLLSGTVVASEKQDLTVGDLAVNLTKLITHRADVEAADAVALLQALGVELPADLEARVSEAGLVDALQQIGVRLTTSNPDRMVSSDDAGRVFSMFDRNDSLFSSEAFKLCKGGADNQNTPCVTDADCLGGYCQTLQSIKCQGGGNNEGSCMSDADCPGGTCNIPPGQAKKLFAASPSD